MNIVDPKNLASFERIDQLFRVSHLAHGWKSDTRSLGEQAAGLANRKKSRPSSAFAGYRVGSNPSNFFIGTPAPPVDGGRHLSSGRTVIETAGHLERSSMRPVTCIAHPAVPANDPYAQLLATGATHVISTDSIVHLPNTISVASLLVAAGAELFGFAQGGFVKSAQQ